MVIKLKESRPFIEDLEDPSDLSEEYSTDQVKVLEKLSYLISTEYDAIKNYDEAVEEIVSSGASPELLQSVVQGIKEIRKDEEDHISKLEEMMARAAEEVTEDVEGETE